MGILAEDIERVRAATDFLAIASEHLALKRVGRRYQGLCPFHAEKTPSFSINAEEGLYYCFGCGAKGDAITFVREVEHLDFAEAMERLASRAGIQLRYDDAAVSRDHQRRARLVEAMARAVDWYHQRLLSAADGGRARDYLRSRGYDGETVRTYTLGWAPDAWDALAQALTLPDDVLRDTGLGFVNSRNRQQDAFRARVMFPIYDTKGDPVAFGGRVLPGGEGPKYKNSPDTALYSKSRLLYGLNWAKNDIVRAGEVIVCEGYTDVIGLARVGLGQAVATCGTALAEAHFRLLKNFARRVVLAYDADAAGQAAAERFYAWERQYEVDISVAELPPGSDPGELSRRDPEALRTAVKSARPFLRFRLDRVLGSFNLLTPEGRARAADAALPLIREHPNELVRDQYLMEIADRCQIDPDRLRAALTKGGSVGVPVARPRVSQRAGPETEALKVLIHRRDEVQGSLHPALFTDELCAAAYRSLAATTTLHEAIESADPGAAALLQRLAVEEVDEEPSDAIAVLVRAAAERVLVRLDHAARGADDPLAYAETVAWLKLRMQDLGEPDQAVGAVSQLVAWLVGQLEEEA